MKLDVVEIEKRYNGMSEQEFSLIDKRELTEIARECYERESARRGRDFADSQVRVQPENGVAGASQKQRGGIRTKQKRLTLLCYTAEVCVIEFLWVTVTPRSVGFGEFAAGVVGVSLAIFLCLTAYGELFALSKSRWWQALIALAIGLVPAIVFLTIADLHTWIVVSRFYRGQVPLRYYYIESLQQA